MRFSFTTLVALVVLPTVTAQNNTSESESYLTSIVSAIPDSCTTDCTGFENALMSCVGTNSTSAQSIAACSCSATTLSATKVCAECINTANSTSTSIADYNGFVQQCISVDYATSGQLDSTSAVAAPTGSSVITTSSPSSSVSSKTTSATATASTKASTGLHLQNSMGCVLTVVGLMLLL